MSDRPKKPSPRAAAQKGADKAPDSDREPGPPPGPAAVEQAPASASWELGNASYVHAASALLRLRLETAARQPGTDDNAAALARARQACESIGAAMSGEPPALIELAHRFGLSVFERELLFFAVARELDPGIDGLCASAFGGGSAPYPTFALACKLFDDPTWDALSPDGRLRFWKLIELQRQGTQGLVTGLLHADERVVNHVNGLDHLDERLVPLLRMAPEPDPALLQPSQQAAVTRILQAWSGSEAGGRAPVVQLLGADTPSKWLVGRLAAHRFGHRLLRMRVDLLPTGMAELNDLARLWQRECALSKLALFFDQVEGAETPSASNPLQRFLSQCAGLTLVDARDVQLQAGLEVVVVDVARPTAAEQRAAWRTCLGAGFDERVENEDEQVDDADPSGGPAQAARQPVRQPARDTPAELSAQFDLDIERIRAIALQLGRSADTGTGSTHPGDAAWRLCTAATRPGMQALAQRIDLRARWDDLVLPPETLELLRRIGSQVRLRAQVYEDWGFARRMNRGLSISALFEGASGVGKTMAAEVIAADLRLDLYRIDLSAVVSKYIGETEQNLRRLFDAAEDGGACLFFDECDALFGKRGEVKESHDRYANIQTNYLLQRLETFRGLAILATNMKSAIDPAFVRRLRFIVNFPFPGPAQREAMWRRAFPAKLLGADLDFARLGGLGLSGGSIHNCALGAAFLAARDGTPITMALVLAAIRTEFTKLGTPINAADFALPARPKVAA